MLKNILEQKTIKNYKKFVNICFHGTYIEKFLIFKKLFPMYLYTLSLYFSV